MGSLEFLSTPSARRATRHERRCHRHLRISIHALREEGDSHGCRYCFAQKKFLSTPSARRATGRFSPTESTGSNFYPRPPRGGRPRYFCDGGGHRKISIHALREEGDSSAIHERMVLSGFLSTPSARRATAKTETKSLFSYKLYNILHEFRRALIYNGSKNDPNHAK